MAKILIVDDEKSIRFTLSEFLAEAGHQVQLAEDAQKAIGLMRKQIFDVVLSDIVLPGLSGVELLTHLKDSPVSPLVILMTGRPTVETAALALRAGAYDYLIKPISKSEILHAIGQAVQVVTLKHEKMVLEQRSREYRMTLEQMVVERTRNLQESESLYQSLVDHLPQNLLRKDRSGCITFSNAKFQATIGRSALDLLGKTDADLYPEFLAKRYGGAAAEVIATGETQETEDEFVLPNGELRYFDFIRTPLRDANNAISGIQCLFWDVTERRRARDQLRKLVRAVDQCPAAIVITDKMGHIEFVNPKFTQITGYTQEEVIMKKPSILKSGETAEETYKTLWTTILSGNEWRGELHNKRKDGTLFWEAVSISPLRDSSGAITHFIAVKEDTTEKKELERKFLRAQRLESIGSLASGIAHDLNNILTPIMICAPLLRSEIKGNEGVEQMLTAIQESAQRAQGIVKQLLSMGRGGADRLVPIQVRHLLREIEKIIRETFPKSIHLQVEAEDELWMVVGSATQIYQILLNLCVNSRDAMADGGTLTIAAENVVIDEHYASMNQDCVAGPYLCIRVSDTGVGISSEIQSRIFDPFFSTKGVEQGTGLGLTTVLGIVKNFHGFLQLKSELGQGCSFQIFLPAVPDQKEPKIEAEVENIQRGHGELILVVDDEESIRKAYKRTLEYYGYAVLLAEDGLDGIEQFSRLAKSIRVVITDNLMPGMNGIVLSKVLHRIAPEMPIIMSTGVLANGVLEADAGAAGDAGVRCFLRKPHTASLLLESLAKMLTPLTRSASD